MVVGRPVVTVSPLRWVRNVLPLVPGVSYLVVIDARRQCSGGGEVVDYA